MPASKTAVQKKTEGKPQKPLSETEILKCEMCLVMTTGSQIHAVLKEITNNGAASYPLTPYPLSSDSGFVRHINNAIALLQAADAEASRALDVWCDSLAPAQERIVGPLVSKAERGAAKREAAKAGQGVTRG